MDVILNIGLAREGNSNIGSGTVIREVINSFGAASFAFKHSDTEITCIANVSAESYPVLKTKLGFLSALLGQDCIAFYAPATDFGGLVGPRADKWGPFNPDFFLLHDGTRLSAQVSKAA